MTLPPDAIEPYALGSNEGFVVESQTASPSDSMKSEFVRTVYLVDGEFIKEFAAVSHSGTREQAEARWAPCWAALEKANMWTVK